MNDVNILEEKPKMKGGFKVLLIFLVLLILVAGGCGAYIYFKKKVASPKAVYAKLINKYSESMLETVDTVDDMAKLNNGKLDFELKLSSNNAQAKQFIDLINKLKLSINYEIDKDNKVLNAKVKSTYDNKQLLNPNLYIRNNDIYLEETSLYNKIIKIEEADLEEIWNLYDVSDIKVIIAEMTKIVKDNLLDKYFTQESVSSNQTKITLKLDSKYLEEYVNAIISDMKSDDKLISAISKLTKLSKSEILDELEDAIDVTNESLIMDTYINNKTKSIEKISLNIDNTTQLELNKIDDVKYEINVIAGEEKMALGSLTVKDNLFGINIDFQGVVIEYTINNNKDNYDILMNFESDGVRIKVTQNGTIENGKIVLDMIADGTSINAQVNYTNTKGNVDNKSITNYVDYDKISSEDMMDIYSKMAENETLRTIMQGTSSIASY